MRECVYVCAGVDSRVCVCICVCWVTLYVCVCVYLCVCKFVCLLVCVFVWEGEMCVHVCVRALVKICIHVTVTTGCEGCSCGGGILHQDRSGVSQSGGSHGSHRGREWCGHAGQFLTTGTWSLVWKFSFLVLMSCCLFFVLYVCFVTVFISDCVHCKCCTLSVQKKCLWSKLVRLSSVSVQTIVSS